MLPDLKKPTAKNATKLRPPGGGKERRAEPRFPVAAMAEATDIKSHTRISGRISDIGPGGCYFEVMSPFAIGAELRVRITRNQQTLTASAKVLYSTGGMGMGLLFTQVEPEQRHVLHQWVGELSGNGVTQTHTFNPNGGPTGSPEASASQILGGPELVREPEGPAERTGMNEDPRNVLNELITLLMRNRVLTDTEGKNLLRKLMTS
ncbi:MAG: PilZ domain-containing protein [Acidobacteria bacterium]|nr:PilZ domain-containing protein [Acidobacteriota bacterium]